MPRKTKSPASETLSFKLTTREKRGLQRLLRQREYEVKELTGRANLSGLLRLMVADALDDRPRRLFLAQHRPLQGQSLDVTEMPNVELLDRVRELFRLRDEHEDSQAFRAEHFPDAKE